MNDLVCALGLGLEANNAARIELEAKLKKCGFFAGGCYHSDYLDGHPTREECDAMLRVLRSLRSHQEATFLLLEDFRAL